MKNLVLCFIFSSLFIIIGCGDTSNIVKALSSTDTTEELAVDAAACLEDFRIENGDYLIRLEKECIDNLSAVPSVEDNIATPWITYDEFVRNSNTYTEGDTVKIKAYLVLIGEDRDGGIISDKKNLLEALDRTTLFITKPLNDPSKLVGLVEGRQYIFHFEMHWWDDGNEWAGLLLERPTPIN